MEPTKHDVYSYPDKESRNAAFEDFRKDGNPEERQAVKYSGNGWFIAVPQKVEKANHGSQRYPRKFKRKS